MKLSLMQVKYPLFKISFKYGISYLLSHWVFNQIDYLHKLHYHYQLIYNLVLIYQCRTNLFSNQERFYNKIHEISIHSTNSYANSINAYKTEPKSLFNKLSRISYSKPNKLNGCKNHHGLFVSAKFIGLFDLAMDLHQQDQQTGAANLYIYTSIRISIVSDLYHSQQAKVEQSSQLVQEQTSNQGQSTCPVLYDARMVENRWCVGLSCFT